MKHGVKASVVETTMHMKHHIKASVVETQQCT